MADTPIKHSDIIQPGDPLGDLNKGLEKMIKLLKQSAKELKKFTEGQSTSSKKGRANIKMAAKATAELSSKEKTLTAQTKQLRKEREKYRAMFTPEYKAIIKTKDAVNAKAAAMRRAAKEMRTGAKSTNTWKKALGSFAAKFNTIGNIAANVASTIARQLNRAMRDAIKIISTFEQAMADTQSITQATDKDFKLLRDSAKKLGQTTKFTATEVAKLQKEFAKLGLSTEEILNAQKATLSLAAATGTELPRAAEVVGITLRQFGLNASEAQRVVDVMAKSFSTSALDMEKFAESMKMVGPIASKAGYTLEQTTARLAQLADAGIASSMGGTALRQIFLEMAKGGKDLGDRIKELSMEEMGLAEASEEVQKRAAAALLVLADGVGTVDDFTAALENAGGTAEEMAEIQLDTLNGQLTLLKSAYDGVIIAIGDTEGAIEGTKDAIGTFAKALNLLSIAIENTREKEGLWHKSQKKGRKIVLENIPVLGRLFRTKNRISEIVNILDLRQQDLNESTQDLQDTWESPGGTNEFFGKLEKIKTELENIEKLINRLDEFRFKEEDQEAIMPDFPGGVTATDKQNKQAAENLKKQQQIADNARAEEFAKAEEARAKEEAAADQAEKDKQAKVQATFELANRLTTTFSDLFESQKQKELSAAGDNAEKRAEIEKKYANRQKILAIGQAVVDGAASILKTKATLGLPLAIPFMIADAALTAAQIAIIASQKFAEGEVDIYGPPHSRGGIAAEIEGGESVINKQSTSKYKGLLQAINANDSEAIANAALQNEAFHDVWGRTRINNIEVGNNFDPYIKKMYQLMENTPTIYTDSDGKIVKQYPGVTQITDG